MRLKLGVVSCSPCSPRHAAGASAWRSGGRTPASASSCRGVGRGRANAGRRRGRAGHQRVLRVQRALDGTGQEGSAPEFHGQTLGKAGARGRLLSPGRASEADAGPGLPGATGQRPGEWGMIGRHLRAAPGLRAGRNIRRLRQGEPPAGAAPRRASRPGAGCRIGGCTDGGRSTWAAAARTAGRGTRQARRPRARLPGGSAATGRGRRKGQACRTPHRRREATPSSSRARPPPVPRSRAPPRGPTAPRGDARSSSRVLPRPGPMVPRGVALQRGRARSPGRPVVPRAPVP
ncbi:hypothetical protein SAMN05216532_7802 [Streptomyces sp. 2231.1]|nr:hypothetical protein SAMN05216532_7802 [Streptomyces sp. 2231.1]